MRAIFRALGAAAVLFAVLTGVALAQTYPDRPVKM